jgi:hypothetical protein
MLIRELIDYLFDEITSGRIQGSDPVPVELVHRIEDGHLDVAEYLADKFKIGGDADGQKDADAVQSPDERTSETG